MCVCAYIYLQAEELDIHVYIFHIAFILYMLCIYINAAYLYKITLPCTSLLNSDLVSSAIKSRKGTSLAAF